MGSQGFVTRLKPRDRRRDAINVYVEARTWGRKGRCFITEFQFGDDITTFYTPEREAWARMCEVERELVREVCDKDRTPAEIIANLHAIGDSLSDVLLRKDTPDETKAARKKVAAAFAASPGPIIYRLGGPIPVELLTFETDVGGVGSFARMLGGRPAARSQCGTRVGRVVGSGAIFFHDDLNESVRSGEIEDALKLAFEHGLELHHELLSTARSKAYQEIERLFQGDSASWVHFQCHVEESAFTSKLRLTNDFKVERDRFQKPGPQLAAIMLNTCSATRLGTAWDSSPPLSVESSWSEYFTGECGVPAVIGPSCTVLDTKTVPYTHAFYRELATDPSVFGAFCRAREERLEQDDYTALVYRYMGPGALKLSEAARIPAFLPELEAA